MTDDGRNPFRVRSLAASVYFPNLLFEVGHGAAIPVIALLALDLGASAAVAGVIVALRGLGTIAFDGPASVIVSRLGERRAMVISAAVLASVALAVTLKPSLPVYASLVFLMGCAWAVWMLARLTYATELSPIGHRGRVMSMLGGVARVGQFIGPLIGASLVIPLGVVGPFVVQALFALGAAITPMLVLFPDPVRAAKSRSLVTLKGVLRDHRRILGTAGLVAVAAQVLRSSRHVIIPLWGDRLGLGPGEISLIFGAASAMEVAVFYPVGILMDRKGRKWASLPFISLLSVGIASIPLTSDRTSFTTVALLIGLANGLGAGFNLTLGSDLSPESGRSQFLGLWRLVSDVGTAGGPLLVAVTTSLASLSAAAVAVGGVGIVGLLVLSFAVPETRNDQT